MVAGAGFEPTTFGLWAITSNLYTDGIFHELPRFLTYHLNIFQFVTKWI